MMPIFSGRASVGFPSPAAAANPAIEMQSAATPERSFDMTFTSNQANQTRALGYYIGRCRSGSTHLAALLRSDEVHVRISRMQRRFIVLIATIGAVSVAWWWWSRASAPISAPLEERTTQPLPPVTAPAAAERPARPMLPPALQLAKPVVLRPAPAAVPGA